MATTKAKSARTQKTWTKHAQDCGYPPPRILTLSELAKASMRSGRGDDASSPMWKYDYDKHRERVISVRSQVDSGPPLLPKSFFCSPARFNRSIANFVRIERDNAIMLKRIEQIMNGPASIDNHLHIKLRQTHPRAKSREMTLLRIAFDNLELHRRIQAVRATYSRAEQLKNYEYMENVMALLSLYPLHWKVPYGSLYEVMRPIALENAKKNPKPKVFFELETDKDSLGKVIIELRADIVPLTAENFRVLCTGEMGISYKCTQIHRIIPDVLWQGGNVIGKDGRAGKSIYGDEFPDENFKLKHSEAGVVSMANYGKNTNGSQFIISATRLSALDGINVVVGKVIGGMGVLKSLKKLMNKANTMTKKVWIASCGAADEYEPGESDSRWQGISDSEGEDQDEGGQQQGPPSTGNYEAEPETEAEA